MSKDTLRFLFRQLADAINFRHDVPAQWFVQSVFDIEEAAASTLELPPLDAFFKFDGRLVALRGVELLGRLAIDNPWNPFATLGVVKLQEPATQPEFVRYVDNDAVVVEKISGDWSVHPKVYYRGFVWNLQHWKLEYATLALWAARWVDKLDRELHNEVTTGAMTSSNDNAVNVRKRKPWLPQAMKLKAQNPNLSDREVAKLVGVHPSTLSKCDSWRMARRKIETCNAKIHRGYVAVDGVDRTVDGIIENDDDDDNEENQFDVR